MTTRENGLHPDPSEIEDVQQLGTDLNRDRLAEALQARGVTAVRQVSLDAVWSALRFRPATIG